MSDTVKIEPFVNYKTQVFKKDGKVWDVVRLIGLSKDLEVMTIPLLHLNFNYTYEDLNLREIVAHMLSANNSDLSFPIILDQDGDVMDGRHRLMKSLLLGKTEIKAVRFDKTPVACRYE